MMRQSGGECSRPDLTDVPSQAIAGGGAIRHARLTPVSDKLRGNKTCPNRRAHPLTRTAPVKITDVAAAAGVAPMTVSRVINTPDRVSPETTARVRAAIDRLGYVPNLIAGGLSSRKSRMVAAIVPTIAHPMFAGVVQAFSRLDAPGRLPGDAVDLRL